MSQALSNLLALLDLEKIEEGLFRGQSEDRMTGCYGQCNQGKPVSGFASPLW